MRDLSPVDFHESARRGDAEVLDAGFDPDLCDAGDYTLLMIAAYNDRAETAERLLARGAAPDRSVNTPLMVLAFNGYDVPAALADRLGAAAPPETRAPSEPRDAAEGAAGGPYQTEPASRMCIRTVP